MFSEGAIVRLYGLQAKPELNGAQGVCKTWQASAGRWLVALDSGSEVNARPQNLMKAGVGVAVLGRHDAAACARRSYMALARKQGPSAADDGCDDFVVADSSRVAGIPRPAVVAAHDAERTPRRSASAGKAGSPPFKLGQAVYGGAQGLQARKEEEEASPAASEGSPAKEEGFEVAEGLRCPRWLWEALYAHQQEGVRWLWNLHQQNVGGVLADDLGLGKTVQTIAFLASLHCSGHLRSSSRRGVLIICPVTLVSQWQKELKIWYPKLDVQPVLHWDGKGRQEIIGGTSHKSVVITSYDALRAANEGLLEVPWAVVILDEGHRIRNPHGQGTLAMKRFNTPHRLILTGSPVHNNLQDLWSLLDFVRPGCLGTLPVFLEEIAKPIEAGGRAGAQTARAAAAYQIASALREIVKPMILRRTKPEVMEAIGLPKKEEQVLLCHLTVEQYAAYLSFLQTPQAKLARSGSRNCGQLIKAIGVCRRLCNHPDALLGECDEKPHDMWNCERSGKMRVLAETLRQWRGEGHRVLVFVQTLQMLQVIQQWMVQQDYPHLRMDSRIPVNKRVRIIEEFNASPQYFAMVLTTRTGGVGLNIIGANRVVLFDPDWNPMTDIQARERAWRIGQNREVIVYRLLLAGTLEEKIYHRQIAKQQLSQQVLSGGASVCNVGRVRLCEAFALPPPPPSFHAESLAALKEKYRRLLQTDNAAEEEQDPQNTADIVQAIESLGGEALQQSSSAEAQGCSALLQTLLDSRGIRASFNGDAVERLLIDRKAVREGARDFASRAIDELKRSVGAVQKRKIGEPTWTGKQGLIGAPQGATSSGSGKRSAGPSEEVMAGMLRLVKSRGSLSEAQQAQAESIFAAFLDPELAGPACSLPTDKVLQSAAAGVPEDQQRAFKSLLGQICAFTKASDGAQGTWTLRPEFRPQKSRRVAVP